MQRKLAELLRDLMCYALVGLALYVLLTLTLPDKATFVASLGGY